MWASNNTIHNGTMSTYIWRLSVALVRTLECVWLVKFIITLVYVYLEQVHGNSYDTPVSVLMLNMIFLVSPFFFFITKLVPRYSVSLTLNFSDIYAHTQARACVYTQAQTQPPTPHRAIAHGRRETLTWIPVSPSSCPSRKTGMHR